MNELITLGSGGWIPTPNRETCCYLYRNNDTILFLDAGTGISNLYRYSSILKKYNEINIILSHFHLDHIIGLSYLLNWIDKNQKLVIWGPGLPYYQDNCENIIQRIIGGDYFSRKIMDYTKQVEIKDYPGNSFKINNIDVEVFLQQHSAPSFGIKIDKLIYYATDTIVEEATVSNSKDCKILLHECWNIKIEDCQDKHSSLEALISQFSNNKDQIIRLIHINPNWNTEEVIHVKNILSKYPNIKLANDFDRINLN
jgi:ribonuclease BN (tRNA processing enzyme)